ncbi:T-complex protein 1 subunit theta [Tanacetum coccineum]
MKAKNHLSAIDWTFFYVFKKKGTRELTYKAPTGRVYVSLRTSCECAIKNQDHLGSFDHMGGSKIDGFKKSKRKAESFFCVDRPEKKGLEAWEDRRIVPGAGATEIEIARQLKAYSLTETESHHNAIAKYVESFKLIQKTLAENAYLDAMDIISTLYEEHKSGNGKVGIDLE